MLTFQERIQKYEYQLNDTEDQIVEFILDHKEEVISYSIQNLAAQLFTVPNTITRLSKKLGFDGYSQMKNSLKEEVIQQDQFKEEGSLTYNIQKTIGLIDQNTLSITARLIHEASRVLFFGVGDTAPFCEMMIKNLKVVGKKSEYYFHRHDVLYELSKFDPGENNLLFLISLSGETAQVLDVAELAKQKGVKLISLTHFSKNTLQQTADVNLFCYSPSKKINEYNMTDKTPLLLVLRALSEFYWKALN
ncbi:MurR/RpiR family transcriptional regulator [Bacillus sp. AFS055030]|uniref:MurR/RpiR family transcriptional regulator n=1 Tax=Bacillus sp. AFS055030 TaxID=2033507 RepID=UPI000BFD55E4|nr:MurR/RpiR family transcriptional regulator [Bacillus sp. AFS055030]PGL70197.1 RpiR family transcriptional regulator [Bacillus sp. AFS055030]